MKKFFLLSVMLLSALSAAAQVYLNPCYPGVKNYDDVMGISAFRYTNGFTLRNGVLNSDAEEWAYAVFSLKGQYEKLSFVVGLSKGWSAYGGNRFSPDDDGTHIVTVLADGRRIFDEVIGHQRRGRTPIRPPERVVHHCLRRGQALEKRPDAHAGPQPARRRSQQGQGEPGGRHPAAFPVPPRLEYFSF